MQRVREGLLEEVAFEAKLGQFKGSRQTEGKQVERTQGENIFNMFEEQQEASYG